MKFQSSWLELSDPLFDRQIAAWYTSMKSLTFRTSTRKEHVQTAVDIVFGVRELEMGHWGGPFAKFETLGRHHMLIFKEPAPRPSATIQTKIAKRKVLIAKKNLVTEKVALLTFWETHMFASEAGSFLQGDPNLVQTALYSLLDDARLKAGPLSLADPNEKPWMTGWYGAEASRSVEWTRTRTERAVKGEASFATGAKLSGEMVWEFKGATAKIRHEASAGIRGGIEASASASPEGISAAVEGSLMVGIEIKAAAEIDINDSLSLGGSAEAFAGAMASGAAKFEMGREGITLAASGELFAGAKVAAKGTFTAKWKGREIFSTEATASLNAGIGVMGEFELSIPRVGASSFTIAGGVTLGVGTDVGTKVEYSMSNLRLSGVEWIYDDVRQALTPEQKRYKIMMGDTANRELCSSVKRELGDMLRGIDVQMTALEATRTR